MYFSNKPIKLEDSHLHGQGSGAELYIVEGDSAASAVAKIRNAKFQAVLPMQGKPMNALKASDIKAEANPLFIALVDALGCGWDAQNLDKLRYERIMLLLDADADGIHCGALMLMFFYKHLRPLLENGHIHMVRPPIGEVTAELDQVRQFAYIPEQFQNKCKSLRDEQISFHKLIYRGLASMGESALEQTCIHPDTRASSVMGVADAEMAIEVFSANLLI